ncbi:unnamed protein product [Trichogramma brassicae]|uniref:Uncharacterized protein n=1 Tax=Trichogramma brassicae TaxID=86971 RepID=A0A6H5I197_9HYME|nr:unnamed protein product [Trichogramma brassicae]
MFHFYFLARPYILKYRRAIVEPRARTCLQTDKRIRVCKYAAKPRLQVNLRYSSSAGGVGVGGGSPRM